MERSGTTQAERSVMERSGTTQAERSVMEKITKKLTNFAIGGLMLLASACAPMQTNYKSINTNNITKQQLNEPVAAGGVKPEIANLIISGMKTTYDTNVNKKAGLVSGDDWSPVIEKEINGPNIINDTENNLAFNKTFNVESKKVNLPIKTVSVVAGIDAAGLNVGVTPVINTRLPLNDQNAACKFVNAIVPADVAIDTLYKHQTGNVSFSFHPSWDLSSLPRNVVTEYVLPNKVKVSIDDFGVMNRVEGSWNKSTEGKSFAGKLAKAVLPSDIAAESVLVDNVQKYQYYFGWDLSVLPQNFVTNRILPQNVKVATNTLGQVTHFEGIWDNSINETDSVLEKMIKFVAPDRITVDKEEVGNSYKNIGFYKEIAIEF